MEERKRWWTDGRKKLQKIKNHLKRTVGRSPVGWWANRELGQSSDREERRALGNLFPGDAAMPIWFYSYTCCSMTTMDGNTSRTEQNQQRKRGRPALKGAQNAVGESKNIKKSNNAKPETRSMPLAKADCNNLKELSFSFNEETEEKKSERKCYESQNNEWWHNTVV